MTEETEDKKTIVQKLMEVSKAIGYLQKDKTNKQQGYKYLSEAKIKEIIKKEFEEQGIIFNYSTEEVREYEISPTSRGTRQFVTIAKGSYKFIDVDSGTSISGIWHGSGTDTGDKGLYKAITGGTKYIFNTSFLIPTGDDPENDDEHPKTSDEKTPENENSEEIDEELSRLLDLAFTSENTREAFLRSFKGDNEKLKEILNKRIRREIENEQHNTNR